MKEPRGREHYATRSDASVPKRARRVLRRWPVLLAVSASLCLERSTYAAALLSGLGGPAGYGTNRLPLGDDSTTCTSGTTGAIDLTPAFPGGLKYFGQTFTSVCLNNNGNVSFGGPLAAFTPSALPIASVRMIAPWWGDVDTRQGSLADATRDAIFWDVRTGQLTATWHNVGYYSSHDGLLNDFQLVIQAVPVCGLTAFDVEFRYNQCQWTTGDATGGTNGLGGTPAQAGFDAGDLVHAFTLPGSLTAAILNLCTTSNVGDPGVWRFRIEGGELPCTGAGAACSTGMNGACGQGTLRCRSGAALCVPNGASAPERCDGIDNDCNGVVDDGASVCTTGQRCDRGACVSACTSSSCPSGQACGSDGRCADAACTGVTCAVGQRCSTGSCVDVCAGIVCPVGTECRNGGCVVPCEGVVCSNGNVCEEGECVADCHCRDCVTGQSCTAGGTCAASDCATVSCPAGQACRAGVCADPCAGAVCPSAHFCSHGRCILGTPPPPDAGADAATEGGAVDAGAMADSGQIESDAMPQPEAGADAAGGSGSGCACHATTRTPPATGLAALAVVVVGLSLRRRNRRRA